MAATESTSAPINVTASAAGAPTVNVTTSAVSNTSTVNSPVTLSATATAAFGRSVASVQFFANGTAVGTTDTTFPYSTTWTPTSPGTYAITATATDDTAVSGASVAVTITITAAPRRSLALTQPRHRRDDGGRFPTDLYRYRDRLRPGHGRQRAILGQRRLRRHRYHLAL